MESLREESNDSSLLDLYRQGDPNTNHFLITKLVSERYLRSVCTTNFDELIERALDA